MKHITFRRLVPGLLAVVGGLALASCEKEIDTYYDEIGPQYPTFLANALGTATKYAPGEVVQFELQFAQQTAPIREIRILQKVEPGRDSTVVQTIPYKAAFSKRKQADTLVVNYTVPAGQNKANVRVDAVVVSDNSQTKTRSFAFRLAEATPTIKVNSTTNVTAPAGATPVPGDVVRYNILLNQGGINTATALTTTGTLYSNLDSLVTYVKVGTAAERRALKAVRLPAGTAAQTGAQTSTNVDVTVPAASSGQEVTYRFEVKSRYQNTVPPAAPTIRTATATAATFTPGTTTALAAARTATLTFTGTGGGDLAAFDLTTFTTVAAADAATSKDISISSTATNAVQLKALNTTKFVATTAAVYTAATLNSIRQVYQSAAAASQLTTLDNVAVGNVFVARLRGLDQYVVFTVTGINRTSATDVAVTLAVKML
ncbi:hypothetical protein SAMN06265337_2451 [Hymenobacter gelipurpurascens]|uniref:Uncharacterized protein n=1 Tax=Hymenobacter gelipurpurascens TaxID=89968 RepID=A0A212U8X2_9BACT|nr:hypothetical protein [Hymenobacter gelipurpurascens]SNC74600.1 hypothetical protein SAMN06265337_2451 [Hymenobacter gelipurpurascens]